MRLYLLALLLTAAAAYTHAGNRPHFIRFSDTCSCNGKSVTCFGYRAADGRIIVPAVHPWLDTDTVYAPRTYVITCDGRFTAVDTTGTALFNFFLYDNGPDYFSEGLARFIHNGRIGYVDSTYRKVIPAQFDFTTPFTNGRAAFCRGCVKTPVIPDHPGTTPLPEPEHFKYSGGTWGFIDRTGTISIPPVPGDIIRFDSTTATIQINKTVTIKSFTELQQQ